MRRRREEASWSVAHLWADDDPCSLAELLNGLELSETSPPSIIVNLWGQRPITNKELPVRHIGSIGVVWSHFVNTPERIAWR